MAKDRTFMFYMQAKYVQRYESDPKTFDLDTWDMYYTASILQDYFDQCCRHKNNTDFAHVDFHWSPYFGAADVQPHELLVYFRPARLNRILQDPAILEGNASGASGLTARGMISEIYLDECIGDLKRARLLANITFHEFLHNKLDADPNNIAVYKGQQIEVHRNGGGGLASDNIDNNTQLTPRNIELMAFALARVVRQDTSRIS